MTIAIEPKNLEDISRKMREPGITPSPVESYFGRERENALDEEISAPIKLTRIGPITLSQQNFTLGKHSSQTYLTLSTPDAFGDMRAEIIDLRSWLLSDGVDEAVNKAQGLLDQLGTHMQSVVSSRSLKGGS